MELELVIKADEELQKVIAKELSEKDPEKEKVIAMLEQKNEKNDLDNT